MAGEDGGEQEGGDGEAGAQLGEVAGGGGRHSVGQQHVGVRVKVQPGQAARREVPRRHGAVHGPHHVVVVLRHMHGEAGVHPPARGAHLRHCVIVTASLHSTT